LITYYFFKYLNGFLTEKLFKRDDDIKKYFWRIILQIFFRYSSIEKALNHQYDQEKISFIFSSQDEIKASEVINIIKKLYCV